VTEKAKAVGDANLLTRRAALKRAAVLLGRTMTVTQLGLLTRGVAATSEDAGDQHRPAARLPRRIDCAVYCICILEPGSALHRPSAIFPDVERRIRKDGALDGRDLEGRIDGGDFLRNGALEQPPAQGKG
jgi:hypothetical protein